MKATYLKTTIHTTTQGTEALAPVLERCGVSSYSVEDQADLAFVTGGAAGAVWDFIDPVLEADAGADVRVSFYLPEADADAGSDTDAIRVVRAAVTALKTEAAQGLYGPEADFGTLSIETESVCDDWLERSRASFHTFSPTKGVVICPPWEDVRRGKPDAGGEAETVIVIDPGMAFGTGSHETTSMCLTALTSEIDVWRAAAAEGQLLRVLDVGTGSGILAIYAALRGAERVVAVEIDPDAAASARGNLKSNGVENRVELIACDVCQAGVLPEREKYDLILANLTCRLLVSLVPVLKERLAPAGSFILSGLLDAQEDTIRAAITAAGLEIAEIFRQGEWITIKAAGGFPPTQRGLRPLLRSLRSLRCPFFHCRLKSAEKRRE